MRHMPVFILILSFVSVSFADPVMDLSSKLMPGVVTVYTEAGLGSGFIVDSKGYIFTNAHVVSKLWDSDEEIDDPLNAVMERIVVALNNKHKYNAKVIGYDANLDVALLKIEPEEKLKVLTMGDSDNVKIGEKVIALGSPLGLEQSVTAGVVSHVGRALTAGPSWDFPINVIQTDAAINPGNSGGPMVNLKGKVIGINYASMSKWSSEGVGFAIPINVANYVKKQLLAYKIVHNGYIGLGLHEITNEYSQMLNIKSGILIDNVFKDSPAEKCGLKSGDIIASLNGKKTSAKNEQEVNDFLWRISTLPPGNKVSIEVLRPSADSLLKNIPFTVQIQESPPSEIELKPYIFKDLGFSVKEITELVYNKYNFPVHKGIWVNSIFDMPAFRANMLTEDVISEVNDVKVNTPEELKTEILKCLKEKKSHIPIQALRRKDSIPLFLVPTYGLKNKKVLAVILSQKLGLKLFEALQMKLLANGVNLINVGVSGLPVDLVQDNKKVKALNPDTTLALLKNEITKNDGVILLSDLDDFTLEGKDREIIKQLIQGNLKNNKLIAAIGSSVMTMLEINPGIKTRKLTGNQKYTNKIKEFGVSFTGNEVEKDEGKIVTATGEEKSYSPFVYEILNTLSK